MEYVISSGVTSSNITPVYNLTVTDGGAIIDTTVRYTSIFISSGGVANNTSVNFAGYLNVSNGGVANNTSVNFAGYLNVSNGGVANDTIVNSNGNFNVFSGGIANRATVNTSGNLHVSDGGVVNGATVNDVGYMRISSGGAACDITLNGIGKLYVANGATATNVILSKGARLDFAVSPDTVIQWISEGKAFEPKNGVLSDYVHSSGQIDVYSGGTVNNATVLSSGILHVSSGGTVNNATVLSSGILHVSSGGVVNNATAASRGVIGVYGGTANDITLNSMGYLNVFSGGIANSTTVNNWGFLTVYEGGVASDITIGTYGRLYLSSGGILTGKIEFTDPNAGQYGHSAYAGGIINFDISALSPGADARINNLSAIEGTPDFTLTISPNQEYGTYLLAEHPGDFSETISIYSNSGETIGKISSNGFQEFNGVEYLLKLGGNSSDLTLTVGKNLVLSSEILSIKADKTEMTTESVTVTATFGAGVASAQYSLDGRFWHTYDSGVVLSGNGRVFFRGVDANGVCSDSISYNVTNIIAPRTETGHGSFDKALDLGNVPANGLLHEDYTTENGRTNYYKFTLSEERFITLETYGIDEKDTIVTLYDADGNRIARDYDNGVGNYSKLRRTLAAGTYYLSVDSDDVMENYTISVTSEPTIAPVQIPSGAFILLPTEWTQSGDDYYTYAFNRFCPVIGGTRSLVGCTAIAYAQIIYYWIKQGYTFDLSLNESDYFVVYDHSIDSLIGVDVRDMEQYCGITMNELNQILETITVDGNDNWDYDNDIAALCLFSAIAGSSLFAAPEYGTGADPRADIFRRIGFSSVDPMWGSMEYYDEGGLSELGFRVMADLLSRGQPIFVSMYYPEHSAVLDGYDPQTNRIHINMGWGANSGRWCTRAELNAMELDLLMFDLYPRYDCYPIVVSSLDSFGPGTFMRVVEQCSSVIGECSVRFADELEGKRLVLDGSYFYSPLMRYGSLVFENFSVDMMGDRGLNLVLSYEGIFKDFTGSIVSDDCALQAGKNTFISVPDTGREALIFENFSGAIVSNAGMALKTECKLDFRSVNGAVFAGEYAGGADVLSEILGYLKAWRATGSALPEALIKAADGGCAISAADFDDVVSLDDASLVLGGISLGGGNDAVSIRNESVLFGGISCSDSLSLTIDSRSQIRGAVTGNRQGTLTIILNSSPGSQSLLASGANLNSFEVSITAENSNVAGTYLIAEQASDFNRSVALTDSSGKTGTLTVGNSASFNGRSYTLNLSGGNLSVTVGDADTSAPEIYRIVCSTEKPTNQDVTVTASFTDNTGVPATYYKLGDSASWQSGSSVSVSGNTIVHFKAVDAAGNESQVYSYIVANIDKEAPAIFSVGADIATPTNQDVTVTASFTDNTGVPATYYKLGDSASWQSGSSVSVSGNTIVHFKAVDAAGNESPVYSYIVANIDKEAPAIFRIGADITTPTNQDVTVTASFTDNAGVPATYYKLGDSASWQSGSSVTVSGNMMVHFKAVDAAGNESPVYSYIVANIDKIPPAKPTASADIVVPTSQSVTVTAVFSDDTATKQYSFDGVDWKMYTAGITFTKNDTVYFRGIDAVGNVSEVTSCVVDNIVSGGSSPVEGLKFFTGDFNGDGYDTIAVEKDSAVAIYMNGEPWGLGVTLDPGWGVVGVGDFNGDLIGDFLRVNDDGYVVGEMSNGNGTFSAQVLNLKNAGWDILGTGDFNGNGFEDVLIANPTGASETVGLLGYWESGVTWTLINGYSAEWECVATGDFDGDGKCDMLWRNSFEGDGGGTYNAYCTWIVDDPVDWRMVSVANPAEWEFLCSGDFDGNGSHDIAMINDVGVVGIWGVNDGYLNSWSILSAVTSEWQLAGVGDFNSDGTDDIAWCNTENGQVGTWIVKEKELSDWQVLANLA